MLVGNKVDLGHLRAVTIEEGQSLAKEHSLLFMETSALDATNVEESFHVVMEEIFKIVNKKHLSPQKEESKSEKVTASKPILIEKPKDQQQGCAC
jgi:Ras-related protein Rab-11A